jgi:hypothetical protein
LSAMPSLGKRASSVQFRVGAPSQSSQRSDRRHKPVQPGAAPGAATIFYYLTVQAEQVPL